MTRGNENKNKALGMPYGTATSKLRKILLFDFSEKLGLRDCYRCGKHIDTLSEFSIEHKVSWLYSENPVETFFDITKIGFSHLICNNRAGGFAAAENSGFQFGRTPTNKKRFEGGNQSWCSICKKYKDKKSFGLNASKSTGLATECLDCRKLRNSK